MKLAEAHAALSEFLQVTTRQRMLVVTRQMEKEMAREVARWFLELGEITLEELSDLEDRFDHNAAVVAAEQGALQISFAGWTTLIENGIEATRADLVSIIDQHTRQALLKGGQLLLNDFDVAAQVSFTLADPRAIAWAEGRAAAQVTRINETTRKRMNTLLTNAVRDGKGWQKVAKEIEETFNDFAGPPLFPSKKFRSRSQAIAAFEIGDAYEAGQWMASESLADAGWQMEKKWLNAGDDRVRPAHRTNSGDGWVRKDALFSGDGAERPPTDPGCRCTLLWRRAPEVRTPRFSSVSEGEEWLQDQGVRVAYRTDDMIDVQWKSFERSAGYRRDIESKQREVRQDLRRKIASDLADQGFRGNELRDRLEEELEQKLAELEPQFASELRREFFENWRDTYAGVEPSQDKVLEIMDGISQAAAEGRGDVSVIIRRSVNTDEEWQFATYHPGDGSFRFADENLESGYITIFDNDSADAFWEHLQPGQSLPDVTRLYENKWNGIYTHEYGHHITTFDPKSLDRAARIIAREQEDIKMLISEYSWSHESELVAEAYALSRHPRFNEFSDEVRAIVLEVLGTNP